MLMAVASNDKAAFDRIWGWTDKTLRNKDNGLFYWRLIPSSRIRLPIRMTQQMAMR